MEPPRWDLKFYLITAAITTEYQKDLSPGGERNRIVHDQPTVVLPQSKSRSMWIAQAIVVVLLAWLVAAYIVIPMGWKEYARHHPSFDNNPRITQTSDRHPGDPLNVSLIGTEPQVKSIMQAAKWYPAAALGLKSDLKIAADTVLSRPDDEAPVSNLFLFGRTED